MLSLLLEKQRAPTEAAWSSLVLGVEPQNTYLGVLQLQEAAFMRLGQSHCLG